MDASSQQVAKSEVPKKIGTGLAGPGRTSIYTQKLADEICKRIAEGESLRSICRDEKMPNERTVRSWALDTTSPFFPQYARAREIAYHSMADELLEIADDGTNDWMERNGDEVQNGEAMARSRLRVDTRKWMLSKMLPKIYGEKIVHAGDDESPIKHAGRIELVIVDPTDSIEG